jgi:hypothetical protein
LDQAPRQAHPDQHTVSFIDSQSKFQTVMLTRIWHARTAHSRLIKQRAASFNQTRAISACGDQLTIRLTGSGPDRLGTKQSNDPDPVVDRRRDSAGNPRCASARNRQVFPCGKPKKGLNHQTLSFAA